MKRLFFALLLLMTAFVLTTSMVEAKPKSGKQHAAEVAKPADAEEQPAEEAPPPPDTSWKGKVGGIVVSLGAEGLATSMGMQPATFGICAFLLLLVLIVIAIYVVVSVSHRRRDRRNAVYAGDYSNSISSNRPARAEPKMTPSAKASHRQGQSAGRASATKSKSRVEVPDGFDLTKFLRSANALFLRLQNAWDNADLADIREFADDEIHDELKLQLRERGERTNKTGVDSLDSKLLKIDDSGKQIHAVVKFSGMVREEGHPAKPFMEVWSVSKPKTGSDGWTVTAIQQFT